MSKNNDVFSVLVTAGAKALATKGSALTALTPGQIGIFDANTNLALDDTSFPGPSQIYLAVGVDKDADGITDDVIKTSGNIQIPGVDTYELTCWSAAQPKIVDITGFKAKCDTEYFLKVGIRSQAAYANYGYNYPFKTFAIKTSCCETACGGCPEGDCTELAGLIVSAINGDKEKLFTATAFTFQGGLTVSTAPTADGDLTVTVGAESFVVAVLDADTVAEVAAKIVEVINATTTSAYVASATGAAVTISPKVVASGMTGAVTFAAGSTGAAAALTPDLAYTAITNIAAFKAAFPGACLGVRVTGAAQGIINYCKTNLNYLFPRGAAIDISLGAGFECNGTVTTVKEITFESGAGYDIAQQEFIAGGWNGQPGPYRQSALVGESIGEFPGLAVKTGKYTQIHITGEQKTNGGWGTYENRTNVTIAVPCGDLAPLADLVDALDKAFAHLPAQATKAGDCSCA